MIRVGKFTEEYREKALLKFLQLGKNRSLPLVYEYLEKESPRHKPSIHTLRVWCSDEDWRAKAKAHDKNPANYQPAIVLKTQFQESVDSEIFDPEKELRRTAHILLRRIQEWGYSDKIALSHVKGPHGVKQIISSAIDCIQMAEELKGTVTSKEIEEATISGSEVVARAAVNAKNSLMRLAEIKRAHNVVIEHGIQIADNAN